MFKDENIISKRVKLYCRSDNPTNINNERELIKEFEYINKLKEENKLSFSSLDEIKNFLSRSDTSDFSEYTLNFMSKTFLSLFECYYGKDDDESLEIILALLDNLHIFLIGNKYACEVLISKNFFQHSVDLLSQESIEMAKKFVFIINSMFEFVPKDLITPEHIDNITLYIDDIYMDDILSSTICAELMYKIIKSKIYFPFKEFVRMMENIRNGYGEGAVDMPSQIIISESLIELINMNSNNAYILLKTQLVGGLLETLESLYDFNPIDSVSMNFIFSFFNLLTLIYDRVEDYTNIRCINSRFLINCFNSELFLSNQEIYSSLLNILTILYAKDKMPLEMTKTYILNTKIFHRLVDNISENGCYVSKISFPKFVKEISNRFPEYFYSFLLSHNYFEKFIFCIDFEETVEPFLSTIKRMIDYSKTVSDNLIVQYFMQKKLIIDRISELLLNSDGHNMDSIDYILNSLSFG